MVEIVCIFRVLKDSYKVYLYVAKVRTKFSEEKKRLSAAFTKLSSEHLIKALEIVAQRNLNFTGLTEEVDLKIQRSTMAAHAGKDDAKNINNKSKNKICDALAKTKKTKVEVVTN
ncbi:hypothetical protein QQ045_000434 [Rhodiola kirilowii]